MAATDLTLLALAGIGLHHGKVSFYLQCLITIESLGIAIWVAVLCLNSQRFKQGQIYIMRKKTFPECLMGSMLTYSV